MLDPLKAIRGLIVFNMQLLFIIFNFTIKTRKSWLT